jgi:Glycosyl transferase family 8
MDRPDLVSAFTKIELWRQTQFDRIVYLDCDVLALRAPDELLSLDVNFAAAPDVGWPDCFNSGVMVLRPNMQDYYSLRALAERGISFDGADQGLFNMNFKNWHRLSFIYNCTPSANYQYIPAYKHFESTIALLHFIGPQKPWNRSRYACTGDTPYSKLLGRWWAVYDQPLVGFYADGCAIILIPYKRLPQLTSPMTRYLPLNIILSPKERLQLTIMLILLTLKYPHFLLKPSAPSYHPQPRSIMLTLRLFLLPLAWLPQPQNLLFCPSSLMNQRNRHRLRHENTLLKTVISCDIHKFLSLSWSLNLLTSYLRHLNTQCRSSLMTGIMSLRRRNLRH